MEHSDIIEFFGIILGFYQEIIKGKYLKAKKELEEKFKEIQWQGK